MIRLEVAKHFAETQALIRRLRLEAESCHYCREVRQLEADRCPDILLRAEKFCALHSPIFTLEGLLRDIRDQRSGSVLQDWVMQIPLREQGTLLTAVRGCDLEAKTWTERGVSYSPGRRLTAFIRFCFMNPADPREVSRMEGAFFQAEPPRDFKPSEFGHLPQHWYSHAMHALEVIAYRHPNGVIASQACDLYNKMVHNLHLNVETIEHFKERLSEDRIANNTVVS